MPMDLYYCKCCAPCISVILFAKKLHLELNLMEINVTKGEHKTKEFTQINPQQTVPTLNDNGVVIAESRAILAYLANQYSENDSLYPRDPKKRAIVDQRLYFDIGTLSHALRAFYLTPLITTRKHGDIIYLHKLQEGLEVLNYILSKNLWVAGNQMTIADYSLMVTVSSIQAMEFNISKYDNVMDWHQRAMETIDPYDETYEGWKNEFARFISRFRNAEGHDAFVLSFP